ncbi:dihydrofolate reductase [Fundicoccus culcitae]|uniref:Dihydrofolate reductase n=1 Tax=Fundicoccus culcitae TaxID=2969821 RepID=A0ABY5P729_9LACT|nr:dihydrofolate reductase [Fundicoccus culcitae]UUX34405.1 dihydrofolate reductase [Fundicoccus culcitae]
MITFVYAQDSNGTIGYQNQLPWSLPSDLAFFKQTTMGHTMLMGRKTFDSMNQRLLPGRQTVVMTNQANYGKDIDGLLVVHTEAEVLDLAQDQEIMVIGGAKIFEVFLPYADRIIRTMIEGEFPSDVTVPEIDTNEWHLDKVEEGVVDEKNLYPHRYEWWSRIK